MAKTHVMKKNIKRKRRWKPTTTTTTLEWTLFVMVSILLGLSQTNPCRAATHWANERNDSSKLERHRQRRQRQHEQLQRERQRRQQEQRRRRRRLNDPNDDNTNLSDHKQQQRRQGEGQPIIPITVLADVPRESLVASNSRYTSSQAQKSLHLLESTNSDYARQQDYTQSIVQQHPTKRPQNENGATTNDEARPLTPTTDTQLVYVSFASGGEYFVDAVNNNDPTIVTQLGPFPLYEYSPEEQAEILERIRADFEGFPIEFVTTEPAATEVFARIEINTNTFLEVEVNDNQDIVAYTAVLFGEAEFVDFMNRFADDTATVDANFWNLLVLLGDTDLFYFLADVDPNTTPVAEALSQVMVTSTANTAAHEMGHLLGLRHYDSLGAPGDGIPDPTLPENIPLKFVPEYPGPYEAAETFNHLLASGASVGLTFEVAARVNRFFSERSAIKLALAFASDPPWASEEDFADPSVAFELSDLIIPNTVETGENSGSGSSVIQAGLVAGRINATAEVDTYTFSLEGNRFLTAEVISIVDAIQRDDVITRVQILQEQTDGTYQLLRESYQEIDSFDPVLIDVPIATTGLYQIRVDSPRTVYVDETGVFSGTIPVDIENLEDGERYLTGDYTLFVYSYEAPLEILTSTSIPTSTNTSAPTMVPPQIPSTQAPIPTLQPTNRSLLEPTKSPISERVRLSSKFQTSLCSPQS